MLCARRVLFTLAWFTRSKGAICFTIRWDRYSSDSQTHHEAILPDHYQNHSEVTVNSLPPSFNDERDSVGLWEKIKEIGNLFTMHGRPWYGHRGFGKPAYFHMHIPKAAGYSVIDSSRTFLPNGTGLFSSEICFKDMQRLNAIYRGSGIITLLRRPSEHVYSQYQMCASDDDFQNRIPNNKKRHFANFTVWLKHFTDHKTTEDFGCYHPHNMQTRYFGCSFISCGVQHGCHFNGPLQPHDARKSNMNLDEAVRNMDSMFFVGLVEHYQASMCAFIAKVTHQLPTWCDCQDKEAWATFRNPHDDHRHHVPQHSVNDITEEEQLMIDRLTRRDVVLYKRAEKRLMKEISELEKSNGVKILC